MKAWKLGLLFLLFSAAAEAQVLTKFGDNVGTLDGILKAFYAVTTVAKGQLPSYERDSLLHRPGAVVGLAGKTLQTMSLKRFHERSDADMAKTGYEEHQIACKVLRFGSVYHVWSTYETRYKPGGRLVGRGIDSIELFFDGQRFWIVSWISDPETKSNPLPKIYLPRFRQVRY